MLLSCVQAVLGVTEGDQLVSAGHLEVEHSLLKEAGHEHGALLPGVEQDALGVCRLESDLEMYARLYCAVVKVEDMH